MHGEHAAIAARKLLRSLSNCAISQDASAVYRGHRGYMLFELRKKRSDTKSIQDHL